MKTSIHSESRTIVSVTETTINPYMFIIVALAIAGAIFGLEQSQPLVHADRLFGFMLRAWAS